MMRLGIDIDSTINIARTTDLKHMRNFMIKNGIPIEKIDLTKYDSADVFGLTDEYLKIKYIESEFPWANKYCPPDIGAVDVIKRLIKNNTIIIITARDDKYISKIGGSYNGKDMVESTYEWFRFHGIPFNDIIFGAKDKAQICKDEDIDIMFDDSPDNIIACANAGIFSAIKSHTYNTYLNGYPNTITINSWYEYENLVQRLK